MDADPHTARAAATAWLAVLFYAGILFHLTLGEV